MLLDTVKKIHNILYYVMLCFTCFFILVSYEILNNDITAPQNFQYGLLSLIGLVSIMSMVYYSSVVVDSASIKMRYLSGYVVLLVGAMVGIMLVLFDYAGYFGNEYTITNMFLNNHLHDIFYIYSNTLTVFVLSGISYLLIKSLQRCFTD